ncbi:asparagine--tRNA ligase [Sulfuriroseicoccus oceanibius]|uniref:Asparagine--tRNA ligase n=1 Tax=Sulfuriroseicoccus oceanibius TaxID=2707525 RepID=A0A6B3L699_9BACT|nr:asparagine--tRNA ligase [Sulfuriroseicoccus oceanibius]QQL44656.1 asparagine--tRNA ligase [Sulfuriroseicoccus oceanibius]
MRIQKILTLDAAPAETITLNGWIRTRRDSKTFSFVELNDGSGITGIQVIVDQSTPGYDQVATATTGASATITGKVVESPGKGQRWEIHATEFQLVGTCPSDYPLQKKGHSPEFLRSISHLRPRTNLFGAAFRLRSKISYAVNRFFNERDFVQVHTPIITASDCEGAGELFRVTTLEGDIDKQPASEDFFGKKTYLTVSGQLEAETFACALGKVYTFGPTFRAENSNTTRHAAEFWMIEPEMAFTDLKGDMDLAEEFVQAMVRAALDECGDDLAFFNRFVEKGLIERLEKVASTPFERLSYEEAVNLLINSGRKFDYPVHFGANLQAEHERFLTEELLKRPVTVYNYPKEIKPFYMRLNDDNRTVTAMDLLVPGIGELIGGSQREERLDQLIANLKHHNLSPDEYSWYTDLRKYGSVPHAGFGLGFERLLMFLSGIQNIRDVIPFARTPGNAGF